MTDTLQLLAPWDLPLSQPLTDDELDRVELALASLTRAFEIENRQEALTSVSQLLADVPVPETTPCIEAGSKVSLRPKEVEAYDEYFRIEHIQSAAPAMTLVRSLIACYKNFLELCATHSHLNPEHVEQQEQGFRSQARLLQRVFWLEESS